MATQSLEFGYTTGQTLTAKLFALGSDTVVATADSVTEATNRKGRYVAAFTDVTAGDYLMVYYLSGSGAGSENYTLTATTATFQPWSEGEPVASADLAAIKAKTDLITSQTANQLSLPSTTLHIIRNDSYSGTVTVTTDYTGYTGTLTIRHRLTAAELCSKAITVTSSTVLTIALATTDTAFSDLVDDTEFGPHPYDIELVSGSTTKTERGVAIIYKDQTTA